MLVRSCTLINEARSLKSEDGENPEYDRALVELVCFVLGGTQDNLRLVAQGLDIDPDKIWGEEG